MRKVIRTLPKTWEVKATTFKKLNDREEIDFFRFIGNLKTHQMEINVHERREPLKKWSIAFKATLSIVKEEELIDE